MIRMIMLPSPEKAEVCAPLVYCDWCGEQIEEGGQGNYEWRHDDRGNGNPIQSLIVSASGEHALVHIAFTHKHCARSFEQANGDKAEWRWCPLTDFPVYLGRILKVPKGHEPLSDTLR